MGIRIGIGSLKIGQGSTGVDWSSYWATLISATVGNAAPTDVVLTFPSGQPSLLATDITATVNGVARGVSSASWAGGVWTVVLASAVEYADVVVVTFKTGQTKTVTNNVLTYTALLTKTGTGGGVSTLRMQVSSNITITLGANAKFYSDAGGTANESATWTITSGALRTIYLKCTTGTATFAISDCSKIIRWGSTSSEGWDSRENSASIGLNISKLNNAICLRTFGNVALTGDAPASITELLRIDGIAYNTSWISNGPLPPNLLNLYLNSNQVAYGYNGPIPATLQSMHMQGALIAWKYTGALPVNNGYLVLSGANIEWTHNGNLPNNTSYCIIDGAKINWTGLNVGNGNSSWFSLSNYRISKMSSADMVTLLTQMTGRTGTLPATITINDYADYASPPAEVVTAVNTLKATKGITTVNLGA